MHPIRSLFSVKIYFKGQHQHLMQVELISLAVLLFFSLTITTPMDTSESRKQLFSHNQLKYSFMWLIFCLFVINLLVNHMVSLPHSKIGMDGLKCDIRAK